MQSTGKEGGEQRALLWNTCGGTRNAELGEGQASLPNLTCYKAVPIIKAWDASPSLPPQALIPGAGAAPAERSLTSLFTRLGNGPLLLSTGRGSGPPEQEAQSTMGRTQTGCASGPALYSARVNARGLGWFVFEFHLELFQLT